MQAHEGNICEGFIVVCVVLIIFAFIVSCPVCLVFYCILCYCVSCLVLYVYGCFGEINYDDDTIFIDNRFIGMDF